MTGSKFIGKVISNRMQKSCLVAVDRLVRHKKYDRVLRRTTKLMAHDEKDECNIGDIGEAVLQHGRWLVQAVGSWGSWGSWGWAEIVEGKTGAPDMSCWEGLEGLQAVVLDSLGAAALDHVSACVLDAPRGRVQRQTSPCGWGCLELCTQPCAWCWEGGSRSSNSSRVGGKEWSATLAAAARGKRCR